MNKEELRKKCLQIRNSLDKEYVKVYSKKISDIVLDYIDKTLLTKSKLNICMYMAKGNEVNLIHAIEIILKDKKYKDITLAFPRVNKKNMDFFIVKSLEDFEYGGFSILEPKLGSKLLDELIDIVFIPAIAFGKDKARIGYGAGYYDRYFSEHKADKFIGIAYPFQIDFNFCSESYDIVMDEIFTHRE